MTEQVTISFYGPRTLREKLDGWAEQEGRSRSSLLCYELGKLLDGRAMNERRGTCPACKRETSFTFIGVQSGCGYTPHLTLWRCNACRSSVSGKHFLSPREEAELVARYGPAAVEVTG